MAAHRPEEALGAVETAEFGGGKQPGFDEVGRALDAVDIFADPVERVEVAQAALAVLDVGLDDIAAVAHAEVACIPFGELGGNELRGRARDDLLAEADTAASKACSSPHSQRASRKAVRTVMSFFASAMSCSAERTEWPTFSFRSHNKCRVASAARSSAVGAFAVRNIRSRSLKGAISPRPVPPRPTSATPLAAVTIVHRQNPKRGERSDRGGKPWPARRRGHCPVGRQAAGHLLAAARQRVGEDAGSLTGDLPPRSARPSGPRRCGGR